MEKEELINMLKSSINKYNNIKEFNEKKEKIYNEESEDYYFQIRFKKLCIFVTMWLGMLSVNQFIDITQELKQNSGFDKSIYFDFIIYLVLLYLNIGKLKGAKDITNKSDNAHNFFDEYEMKSNAAKTAIEFLSSLTSEEEEKYLKLRI